MMGYIDKGCCGFVLGIGGHLEVQGQVLYPTCKHPKSGVGSGNLQAGTRVYGSQLRVEGVQFVQLNRRQGHLQKPLNPKP